MDDLVYRLAQIFFLTMFILSIIEVGVERVQHPDSRLYLFYIFFAGSSGSVLLNHFSGGR